MSNAQKTSSAEQSDESDAMDVTIGFTDTARRKQSSFLDTRWVKVEFAQMLESYPSSQEVWSKGWYTSEYHLRLPAENYVAVFIDQIDHFAVVTQMHDHDDYYDDPVFDKIEGEMYDKIFGNRVPAGTAQRNHEEPMDVTVAGERTHGATRGDM